MRRLAEVEGASLIVVGSSHRGRVGRVLAGTVGDRLLHGATCPVRGGAAGAGGRGSRAYGPVGSVLLGSVSHQLVREAPCPVIVVPRTATQTLGPTATGVEEVAAQSAT